MRIFSDSHHSGLYRSIYLTLQDRLGHEVWFPCSSFAAWANQKHIGAWLSPNIAAAGGIPDHHLDENGDLFHVCSKDHFMEMDWDAVVITRPESEPLFRQLLAEHAKGNKIKRIGQAGNEGQSYDWGFVPNFLSSDYLSFLISGAPNKIHYMQEIGRQFIPEKFTPVTAEQLNTVNTFINCLDSFRDWRWDKDRSWWNGTCPHCDATPAEGPAVFVRDIWGTMKTHLPDYRLLDHGINNSQGVTSEKKLPQTILAGALTWGFKTYDGFGHSLAQSVSMGRLCLVPRRFHRYRTANQFLIPNLTCLEVDWTPESCCTAIRWFTDSLERVNEYSGACFKAAQGVFNWEFEAFKVKQFLENLQ